MPSFERKYLNRCGQHDLTTTKEEICMKEKTSMFLIGKILLLKRSTKATDFTQQLTPNIGINELFQILLLLRSTSY